MRRRFNPQIELGATPIKDIKFNIHSRDDIPQLLRGLQQIYINHDIRDAVFDVLERDIGKTIDFNNGRPGMDLWVLFVLGIIRLGLNCDYDRLHELVNEHATLRAMLGHDNGQNRVIYSRQTLRDNVSMLTEEMLAEINQIIVSFGHNIINKSNKDLKGRCDSFVVKTNVEFPTDTGMLFDAMRKSINLVSLLCAKHHIGGWRQSHYNICRLKNSWRKAQKSCKSRRENANIYKANTHKNYLSLARKYYQKIEETIPRLEAICHKCSLEKWNHLQESIEELMNYQKYAEMFINQISRRVLSGEVIPPSEKIYSIFQPHTEWISKGKAGVSAELGLNVCIMEDQYQFILHHHVMEKQQDVDVAVSMVTETQKQFPNLKSCSYDKGFHSPSNHIRLNELLDDVILPRKGRLSAKQKEHEQTAKFKQARRQHSAVESAINALEQHGLDVCPDHGLDGFKRYIALAIVSRNIKRIGCILARKEQKRMRLRIKREDKASLVKAA